LLILLEGKAVLTSLTVQESQIVQGACQIREKCLGLLCCQFTPDLECFLILFQGKAVLTSLTVQESQIVQSVCQIREKCLGLV
jgi:hydroxymethylpyrimidine/phosphomethylpyrimidine kinase